MTNYQCSRCHKDLVLARHWEEKLPNSTVYHKEFVCADSACQKITDDQNAAYKQKRFQEQENKAKAELLRKEKVRVGLTLGKARVRIV